MEQSLPDDVLRFIWERIDRIETLEVLLLLRAQPARKWTARQVNDEMRSSLGSVESVLQGLHGRGLLAKEADAFSFHPATPDLSDVTSRLAACYRERRTAVITAIFSKPHTAVRDFAEAFRFKKGKPDG